jgi:hypothetical protein
MLERRIDEGLARLSMRHSSAVSNARAALIVQ